MTLGLAGPSWCLRARLAGCRHGGGGGSWPGAPATSRSEPERPELKGVLIWASV